MVAAALADLESAPVGEGLRATLRMLGKLTQRRPPVRRRRARGARYRCVSSASRGRPRHLLRLQRHEPAGERVRLRGHDPEGFRAGARYLLRRGYREPSRTPSLRRRSFRCHERGCRHRRARGGRRAALHTTARSLESKRRPSIWRWSRRDASRRSLTAVNG